MAAGRALPEPAIRPMTPADLPRVSEIYAHYVLRTVATFDLLVPSLESWQARLEAAGVAGHPWLVSERAGTDVVEEERTVVGYAIAGPYRPRPAWRPTVETAIYLAPEAVGNRWGEPLYRRLLADATVAFHRAIAGISLPNPASVRLHERLGFHPIGVFPEVGYKLGGWRDVGYWQRPLGDGAGAIASMPG